MIANELALLSSALAGHTILLVGGDPRPHQVEKLKAGLRLAELIHCPTNKSDASPRRFDARLVNPELVLAVCARGLTRTHHGSALHARCRQLGLPLLNCNHIPNPSVLLPAVVNARLTDAVLRRCAEVGANLVHEAEGDR